MAGGERVRATRGRNGLGTDGEAALAVEIVAGTAEMLGRLVAEGGVWRFDGDAAAEAGIGGGGRGGGEGAVVKRRGGGRGRGRAEGGAGLAGMAKQVWGRGRRVGHGQWAVMGGGRRGGGGRGIRCR